MAMQDESRKGGKALAIEDKKPILYSILDTAGDWARQIRAMPKSGSKGQK